MVRTSARPHTRNHEASWRDIPPRPAVEDTHWFTWVNDQGQKRFACKVPGCSHQPGEYSRKHTLNEQHLKKWHNLKAGRSMRPVAPMHDERASPPRTNEDEDLAPVQRKGSTDPRSFICSLSSRPCPIHGGRLQIQRRSSPVALIEVPLNGQLAHNTNFERARKGKQAIHESGIPIEMRASSSRPPPDVPNTPLLPNMVPQEPPTAEYRQHGTCAHTMANLRGKFGQPCTDNLVSGGIGLFGRFGQMSDGNSGSPLRRGQVVNDVACQDTPNSVSRRSITPDPDSPLRYSRYHDMLMITALNSIQELLNFHEDDSVYTDFLIDQEKLKTPPRGHCSSRPIRISDSPVSRRLDNPANTINLRWDGNSPCTIWVKASRPIGKDSEGAIFSESAMQGPATARNENEANVMDPWSSPPPLSQLVNGIGQSMEDPNPTPLFRHGLSTKPTANPLPVNLSQLSIPDNLSQVSFMSLQSLGCGTEGEAMDLKLVDYASDSGSELEVA